MYLNGTKSMGWKTFLRVGLPSFYFKNDQAKLSLQILVIDGKPALFFPLFCLLFYF